ncbi:hypothetical protein ACIQAC_09230 [Streptomyces sp. NPDC088387]|uniref:hypothetical protein n=1 Tax=Streptomyces sp. NPDC088387 TaxID=3365859 RepID=UPI0038267288
MEPLGLWEFGGGLGGEGTGVEASGIRSGSGPASGAAGSAGASEDGSSAAGAVFLPFGRMPASRRPSAVSCSLPGAGGLRGVNQPLPLPEVPLSADVVVGASMMCLASNIFRSVHALPHTEDACFPPADGSPLLFPHNIQRGHIQPVFATRTDK